jgi:hypothetical protein
MAKSAHRDDNSSPRDFADFAQEFLRRSPDYQRDYDQLVRQRVGGLRSSAGRRMAMPWGLEFPD